MVCATLKEGIECFFMSKQGCQFNGGNCHPVVEKCEGCEKVKEFPAGKFCVSFPDPTIRWRVGTCSMATHVKATKAQNNGKINPLKASKRGAR